MITSAPTSRAVPPALTALLWIAFWKLLPETLPPEKRQSLHPAYLGRAYWNVMSAPPYSTALRWPRNRSAIQPPGKLIR